ncbi:MAG: arsenate reductase ArsC [Proteobacteria bacterium]|nr:arsenate reductase ArsC [Pseudomonadota bacterium]
MNLLFLCTGNSCRSQMAEGWAREFSKTHPAIRLTALSAGLEAHGLNPRAVRAMGVHGVDISNQTSDSLNDRMLEQADLVITVCSQADANCPLIPPGKEKLHIPFPDPANASGTDEEIDALFNDVCLQIRDRLYTLLPTLGKRSPE